MALTDRISAFDVIMTNGVPGKGKILNQMTLWWFKHIEAIGIPHHLITANVHEVSWTDMEDGSISLNRAAVIDGHLSSFFSTHVLLAVACADGKFEDQDLNHCSQRVKENPHHCRKTSQ